MSTRKLRQKDGAVYFATFTCHQWVPLFHELDAYDVVYNWMNIAHGKGYRFLGCPPGQRAGTPSCLITPIS